MTLEPTENQIATVLAKFTSRQVAIAYLRAQRRARDSDVAFGLACDVADLTLAGLTGDMAGAEAAVKKAERRAKMHGQISEAQ